MKKSTQKLKKITRVLFGRTAFVIIAILMQFAFFFILINWLYRYSVLIHLLFVLLGMFVVIHIFNEDTNSAFKMAWIIPVLIIPIFGTMIYVFVNLQLGTKIMRSRLASIDKQLHEKAKTSDAVLEKLESELHGERGLASYLHNAGDFPAYYDNDIEFFPLGEFKFEEMKKQLMAAEKFIFMEYFIVTDSYMWRSILDILKLKASQGVEVRFMYDGMCSLALLPYGYYKELENMGIKSRPFSQIKPVLSTVQNNRDHRKILIVDGKTAFDAMRAGDKSGKAVVDEYLNYLGCGLTNVVNTFQPEMLLIGGGICKEGDYLTKPLEEYIKRESYCINPERSTVLGICKLGNDAGIVGAANLYRLKD